MCFKISWILRGQLILFYTVSKQDISRVSMEKGLLIIAKKIWENGSIPFVQNIYF